MPNVKSMALFVAAVAGSLVVLAIVDRVSGNAFSNAVNAARGDTAPLNTTAGGGILA